jgi:hypothetical protein
MRPLYALLLVMLTAVGCTLPPKELPPVAETSLPPQGEPAPPPSEPILLQTPLNLGIVELAPQAIPIWRGCRARQPILLLLTADPMLSPIPQPLQPEVATLVEQGDDAALRARSKRQIADPLLLPEQTISAVLQAGFFRELLWLVPLAEGTAEIPLDTFRKQLVAAGVTTEEEAAALSQTDGVVSGRLRGLPFRAASIRTLPKLEGPVVLHLDLGYFAALFENEVSTPIYSLAHRTLMALRQAGLTVAASTLAVSTEEDEVPLDLRFLMAVLSEAFARPNLLDEPMPDSWNLRREARYLETFFQAEPILERYLQLQKLGLGDASVEFDLYRTFGMLQAWDEAEKHLEAAVRLDPGYGREYVNLGLDAAEMGAAAESLILLEKALTVYPGNLFLRIEKINALLATGQPQAAQALLQELQKEHWSPLYHPQVPAILVSLHARIQGMK